MKDKWGRRLFKAGGVVLVLLGLVHSLSLIKKRVPANDAERQLLGLMSSYKLNLMGSMRSMDNLFRGFSISFTLWAIGLGLLALLLAGERAGLLKRVALIYTLWLAAMTAVSVRYFFPAPTSFIAAALLTFGLAWVLLPSAEE